MASEPNKRDDGDVVLQPKKKPKLEKARKYQVVFHNDDYTTKWFVVEVLERFFHMSEASAMAFMLVVHTTGRGVAGVYAKDIAETVYWCLSRPAHVNIQELVIFPTDQAAIQQVHRRE